MVLPDLSSMRLVCLGDLMVDFFVRGVVERISPEAPALIMRPLEKEPMLGGVGNVARNLVSLGAQVSLISVIGDDEAGLVAEGLLSAASPGLTFHLMRDPSRKTTEKTRFISGSHHLLRLDIEDHHPLTPALEAMILEKLDAELDHADFVLLSDYKKGFLGQRLTREIIQRAKAKGKRVLIDPKGRDYNAYDGAHVLKPNSHELQEATSLPTITDADIEAAADTLFRRISVEALVVTRGKQGLSILRPGEPARHIPTHAQDVFDVSGAGDTVMAALGATLARGMSLEEAAIVANHAAGIAVSKMGTSTVSYQELANSVHKIFSPPSLSNATPFISLQEAVQKRALWKAQGKRVAFTNGCFDMLHSGHLKTFLEARTRCDHLIVGLNTDASVKSLKGDARPIQNQDLRAAVLAALPTVDAIVLFDTPTPFALIEALKPDLLLKGADYTLEQLGDGAAFVSSYGGEIFLVPLLPDHSTSQLVDHFLTLPPGQSLDAEKKRATP